ncbi:MAG: glycoside hydrolase, partial [Clostridiaceae bacterium]|nr:glycoside hydrolase [Clostridiaceae bacterium]
MKKFKFGKLHKQFTRAIITILLTSLILPSSVFVSKTQAATSPRTGGAYYKYGEAMQKAILFYKANRLGDLPDDYILPYRTDAAMTDGMDVGLDLTGGWADAGDGIKFTHTISYAAAQLGWDVYEYRSAFEKSGQLDVILDEIKWGTDFLIKAHPKPEELYYMCGYNESDHGCWVPHEMLDVMTDRKSFVLNPSTPGSDIA